MASTCLKLINIRPKCAKFGCGHKIDNCGLKCSFCFGLGHTKDQCWKKTTKRHVVVTKKFDVLVNDEEATLLELI
jgi:hypothetical protein